jgi:uncharacterized LabA/DUF88 family protein
MKSGKPENRPTVYAFIDSQNLNLGTSKNLYNTNHKLIYKGWRLDFGKFYRYLCDKFRVKKAIIFIGYIKQNEGLYEYLKSLGYTLVFKPTTKDSMGNPKGNIDAELVLHSSAIEFGNYDKAVVVSGDGDFYCLYEYLVKKKKLLNIIIPNRKAESSLLLKFQNYKIPLIRERAVLELKQKWGA